MPLIRKYWLDDDDRKNIPEIELPKFMKISYCTIENISSDDAIIYRFETLNRILMDINYNIHHDHTYANIILDFDSMFILYRYFPVRRTLSPLIWKEFYSKRHYSTSAKIQPWIIYEDPLKWDLLDEEPVKKFITKFFEDIVSNCPGDQHIEFNFMVRWQKTFGSFNKDTQYSSIEVISKYDVLFDRKKLINKVHNNIWEHISKDPGDLMILDFDSMYLLYRYVPRYL